MDSLNLMSSWIEQHKYMVVGFPHQIVSAFKFPVRIQFVPAISLLRTWLHVVV
jgi:hypothetical protein